MFLYIFSPLAKFVVCLTELSLKFFPGYYIVIIVMVIGALFHYIFKVITDDVSGSY